MSFRLHFPVAAAIVCLLQWTSVPLRARLGESETQSQSRYGAPVAELIGAQEQPLLTGAKEMAYSFQGWRIRVAFLNGSAVRLEYAKIPEGGAPKKLTDAEVQTILDAEKGAFRWREEKPRTGFSGLNALKTAFEGRLWERSDHATARLKYDLVMIVDLREVEAYEKKQTKSSGKPSATPRPGVPKF